MRPLSTALVAAALLAVSACGVDVSQSDDVDLQTDTIRAGLAALYAGADDSVEAQSECFADELTDRLAPDELLAAGLVQDDGEVPQSAPVLEVDVAGTWVDAAGACEPYVDVSARAAAARQPGLDVAAYAVCLGEALTPGRIREALVATLTGRYSSDPAARELSAAEVGCAG